MSDEFNILWDYFYTHKFLVKRAIKYALITLFIIWAAWAFILKRPIYQRLYGTATDLEITDSKVIAARENFIEPIGELPNAIISGSDFTLKMTFLKQFTSTAKIVYIDRYTKLGTWYRGYRSAYLYDRSTPLDLAWLVGNTARPEVLNGLSFSHEYRVAYAHWETNDFTHINKYFNIDEFSNNHIIPSNKNIKKALEILKTGENIYVEGYLIHAQGMGKDSKYEITSALTAGEKSKQLIGGRAGGGKCRQLFITKLVFDGFVYE